MKVRGNSSPGFSLIELMIIVGIVSLLSSVAVPMFFSYMARSKASEAVINLRVITEGVKVYFGSAHEEKSGYCPESVGLTPPSVARAEKNASSRAIREGWFSRNATWTAIGFAPATNFYYSYRFESPCPSRGCVDGDEGLAMAVGDLDGDGVLSNHVVALRVRQGALLDTVVYSLDPLE